MPDDVVEPLDGPEEKIIDEENGRTYDVMGVVVLNVDDVPDTVGDAFKDCKIDFASPVWVYPNPDGDGLPIGTASLYVDGTQIKADLFLTYSSEIRLLLETKSIPLYPSIMGQILDKEDGRVLGSSLNPATCRLKHVQIDGIGIHSQRNADQRIRPIGE